MGMKKRKEGGQRDALISNLEAKGQLGEGVCAPVPFGIQGGLRLQPVWVAVPRRGHSLALVPGVTAVNQYP